MHSFEYILIMLGGVLLSSLVSHFLPRVSTPLIQIAIGIVLSVLPIDFEITFDPELFMVLFIAPLLFDEAKRADKPALWRLKRPILALAVGLVFATTLIVGFSIHLFAPSIPLAAAFALAAALAPTDAVSVASLKDTATISDEQGLLLKGEALLNDAASIVSFQFAIAAAVTGSFSLLSASGSFLLMFFGGLALGVVLMLGRYASLRFLRAHGIELTTFMVLAELVTPFLVYLVAEVCHVSGIIAVVAAGITYSFSPRPTTPANARYNIVSTSVWAVGTFTLNGLVFLLLGTQLPYVAQRVWSDSPAADNFLILFIIMILAVILALRFIWVFVMHRNVNLRGGHVEMAFDEQAGGEVRVDAVAIATADTQSAFDEQASGEVCVDPDSALVEGFGEMSESERDFTVELVERQAHDERRAERARLKAARKAANAAERRDAHADPHFWSLHLKDALLLSLTGTKGAITLAVVLTIPLSITAASGEVASFPERDLSIFLASGVILLSLILTNITVPLLAPKAPTLTNPEAEIKTMLRILRGVILKLSEQMTPETKAACDVVIRHYNARIRTLKSTNRLGDPEEERIRAMQVGWERDHTLELIDEGRVSVVVGLLYLNHMGQLLARLQHRNTVGWEFRALIDQIKHRWAQIQHIRELRKTGASEEIERISRKNASFEMRELRVENARYTLGRLQAMEDDPATSDEEKRVLGYLIAETQRHLMRRDEGDSLVQRAQQVGRPNVSEQQVLLIERHALELEREHIEAARNDGSLSRPSAKQMLDNVAMMELDIEEQLEE
ncbi:MAG: sodium:proton antiporter [Coriobacteriales bacterium]|jgi:CPA1 family monovalent cation:H+ antiporter|nr:sodium:proton antiporter [Coriobacteriales bacterium]